MATVEDINDKSDLFAFLAEVFGVSEALVKTGGLTFTAQQTVTTPERGATTVPSYYQGDYPVIIAGLVYTAMPSTPGQDGFPTEWWNQDNGVKTGISRPPYDNWEYVQAIHSTPGTANWGTNMMKWDGTNTFKLSRSGGSGGSAPSREAAEQAAGVPADVTSAVTTLVDATDDSNVDTQCLGALQAYEAGAGFTGTSAQHKRGLLKGVMTDILARVTTAVPRVPKAALSAFLVGMAASTLQAMPAEIEVRSTGTHSCDLSDKGVYCPLEDGESVTLNDSGFTPAKTFVIANTGGVFSLTVDGATEDLGGASVPGETYTWTDTVQDRHLVFGSVTMGGGGSSGGSGDPYLKTML